nr:putative F-box protein At3g52320 [Ipomoea batatas]
MQKDGVMQQNGDSLSNEDKEAMCVPNDSQDICPNEALKESRVVGDENPLVEGDKDAMDASIMDLENVCNTSLDLKDKEFDEVEEGGAKDDGNTSCDQECENQEIPAFGVSGVKHNQKSRKKKKAKELPIADFFKDLESDKEGALLRTCGGGKRRQRWEATAGSSSGWSIFDASATKAASSAQSAVVCSVMFGRRCTAAVVCSLVMFDRRCSKGLLLEHEHHPLTERLRIRNPATRQTVYLPDLRFGDESPAWVVARMFFVAKSINECTVISFSASEESVLLGRFRAVTVGVDATWRPLKNSPPNSIHCISNAGWKPKIYALSIKNIFYVVTMDVDDKKILWVDAENESIKTAKIPKNLFSDWRFVMPREWNSKLSLCYDNGDDEINIWVLMNNSKNEWAKTQTVDAATFTQDYPIPFIAEEEKRWEVIWCSDESVDVPWLKKDELSIKPTVLQLKGMQSDKIEEAIGARFLKERDVLKTTSQIISAISLVIN